METLLLLSDAAAGWVGGVIGASIGVLGGAFGTWNSLRQARSGRERAYLKRAAFWVWIGVLAFVAAMFVVPKPWAYLLWAPYALALVWGVQRINRDHARIRVEESGAGEADA